MNDVLLHLASSFFFIFHTVLIVFNLLGWLWKKTRKLNLLTLLITFASWFILGIWKGWGYCILTDWHYDILRQLGENDMPNSYISFLVEKLTGYLPNPDMVEWLTIGLGLTALACSIWVNYNDRKRIKT